LIVAAWSWRRVPRWLLPSLLLCACTPPLHERLFPQRPQPPPPVFCQCKLETDAFQLRYARAIHALGYAHGLVSAMYKEIPLPAVYDDRVAWLRERIVQLLDADEIALTADQAAGQDSPPTLVVKPQR